MNKDIMVDFPTFYYYEILENIRERAHKQLSESDIKFLDNFLKFLEPNGDVRTSLEKLASFQLTGDLSIFFADIIDNLSKMNPEEAWKKVYLHADDFLELFGLLSREDAFRKFIEEVSKTPAAAESVAFESEPEVSFEEYLRVTIREGIQKTAEALPTDKKGKFQELLETVLENIDRVTEVISQRPANSLESFLSASKTLINGKKQVDDIDLYIQTFSRQLEEWLQTAKKLILDQPELVETIMAEVTGKPAEVVEQEVPMEKLFEQGEGEASLQFPAGEAEEFDLDNLAKQAQELERKRTERIPETEETLQQKELLKEYVIQQTGGFKEEVLGYLDGIFQSPQEQKFRDGLLDSLKAFKDLGQIHGYPAIELSAEFLMNLFQKAFREEKKISQSIRYSLIEFFDILPEYVKAKLEKRELPHLTRIQERLKRIAEALEQPELELDIKALEALRVVYQQILDKNLDNIGRQLQSVPLTEWDDLSVNSAAKSLETAHFWAKTLKLHEGSQILDKIRIILTSYFRRYLTPKDIGVLKGLLESLKGKFTSLKEAEWERLNTELDNLLSGITEISVTDAIEAFKEIVAKQLNVLLTQFAGIETPSKSDILENFLPFTRLFQQNVQLLNQENLQQFSDELVKFVGNLEKIPDSQFLRQVDSAAFSKFLTAFADAIGNLPAAFPADRLITAMNEILKVPEAEIELAEEGTESVVEREEKTEEAVERELSEEEKAQIVTDEEIERVFQSEASRYLDEIRSCLDTLSEDVKQIEWWKKAGVAAHTLNGSAQMTGHQEVVALTTILEDSIEEIVEGKISPSPDWLQKISDIVEKVEKILRGESVDVEQTVKDLEEFKFQVQSQEIPASSEESAKEILEEVSKEAEQMVEEEEIEEKLTTDAFLSLSETDPEMLKIFEEEVSNNYEVIEKNLANLEKFTYDKEAWQDVERAAHEIHAAAKMLGIGEVGQLAERMESIVEDLLREKITDSHEAIQLLRKTMQVIRELTTKHQIQTELYESTLNHLDNFKEQLVSLKSSKIEEEGKPSGAEAEVEEKTFVVEASPQLLETFVQETRELLDDTNYLLLKLEKQPDNAEFQHHLMRTLHTLKGSAGVVRVHPIEQLAHYSEEIIEQYIEKKQPLPEILFDLLFEIADEISFIAESIDTSGKTRTKNYDGLIRKLKSYSGEFAPTPLPEESPEPEEAAPFIEEAKETPQEEVKETEKDDFVKIVKPDKIEEQKPVSPRDTSIRLDIRQMDNLLNLSAELVIGHTQFKNQLDRLKNYMPMMESELKVFRDTENYLNQLMKETQKIQELLESNPDMEPSIRETLRSQLENLQRISSNLQALQSEFSNVTHSLKDNAKSYDEHWQKLNSMSTALLDAVMKARLVPINILFQRFHRPIRDLAKKFNKKIRLVIQGENTELDRTLIEELYEPLLHVIRNSLDHGLETIEERHKAGKPPEGLLSIKASSERNQVIIEIKDDGRGIDFEKVKEKAIKQGFLTEEKAQKITREDLTEFLFVPGFTTTEEATLVSGRGVGLDVVRAQVEKIKGDLRIHSETGKGTTVTIRVPVSLSVLQSMLIDVGGHIYTIPIFQVEETQNISLKDLEKRDGVYYLQYHEQSIPVIQLSRLLVIKGIKPRPLSIAGIYPVIIVQDEGHRVALLVDRIVRREEILIKSLGPTLRRLKYIAGGSIMADGHVVLVLDVPQIVQEARRTMVGKSQQETSILLTSSETPGEVIAQKRRQKKSIRGRKPSILIVDDSLSIRKYLSNLLSQRGLVTETARNGYEALELLNTRQFDLMITDLEMPKLSGYELIEAIRMDEKYDEFPIIVLTGRANENIRRMTEDLGADDYIVKPFKDRELFESIEKFIEY